MPGEASGAAAAGAAGLPFPLGRTWGQPGTPKPAQHVLLAEFDIDKGWCVRSL